MADPNQSDKTQPKSRMLFCACFRPFSTATQTESRKGVCLEDRYPYANCYAFLWKAKQRPSAHLRNTTKVTCAHHKNTKRADPRDTADILHATKAGSRFFSGDNDSYMAK